MTAVAQASPPEVAPASPRLFEHGIPVARMDGLRRHDTGFLEALYVLPTTDALTKHAIGMVLTERGQ